MLGDGVLLSCSRKPECPEAVVMLPKLPRSRVRVPSPAPESPPDFVSRPCRARSVDMLDAPQVFGEARVGAEVFEQRYTGTADPAVGCLHGLGECFECARELAQGGLNDRAVNRLDVLGLRAALELSQRQPCLIGVTSGVRGPKRDD